MSQIAEFFVVDRDRLPALVEAAKPKRKLFGKAESTFAETFDETARELAGCDEWPGYYFGVLLPYLDEKGVPLMGSEFDDASRALSEAQDAMTFIFTPAPRAYLPQLAAEALAALRHHIDALDDSSVLVLRVG